MGGSSSGAPMKRSVPQSHENLKNHHNSTHDRLHFEVHKGGTNNCFQCGKAGHYTTSHWLSTQATCLGVCLLSHSRKCRN
jgi:hypothetical protein